MTTTITKQPTLSFFSAEILFPFPTGHKVIQNEFISSIRCISDDWKLEWWDRANDHELILCFFSSKAPSHLDKSYHQLLILLNAKLLEINEELIK